MFSAGIRNGVVTLLLISLLPLVVRAHDPYTATGILFKKEKEWRLKISFGTAGLVEAMRSYYHQDNLVLEASKEFEDQVNTYLTEQMEIKINKHLNVVLQNTSVLINHHACEIEYRLSNVPPRPEYWEIRLAMGKENLKQSNVLKTQTRQQTRLFKLKRPQNFSISLLKDTHDHFNEVTSD